MVDRYWCCWSKEFGYLKSTDTKAAKILNEIIKKPVPENKFRRLIAGKTVFVIGAGPSLNQTIQTARKMKATKIVADSAVKAALKAGIIPDIVLTDLDGDADALQKAANSRLVNVSARAWRQHGCTACGQKV